MTKSSTRPWKKVLATTPTNTENSLVSLYDLFYDSKTDRLWVESENTTAGCSLEHDIICLNSAMLKSDNSIDLTSAPDIRSADWWRNGIDISLPIYDARARSKEITCNASIPVTIVGGTTSERM